VKYKALFDRLPGWTTRFSIEGSDYGGVVDLCNDTRLRWHIDSVGGIKGKTVLELGPLEGAHTLAIVNAGAESVTAIEGDANNFLKCLLIKELIGLRNASFEFGDFNEVIKRSQKYDIVSAAGVLYHQTNPVLLIRNLAHITNKVFVWSHVAGENHPSGKEVLLDGYKGRINNYAPRTDSYCAGLSDYSVWLYPDEMTRCFIDSGFKKIITGEATPNPNGDNLLFVALK
jgi:hypothetical protein